MFRRLEHGSDDAFGIASATAPDLRAIVAGRDERRHGVHVCGERDDGGAEADEDVIAILLNRKAFDFAVKAVGEIADVVEQELADFVLVRRYRFDVDQGPGKLKYVHDFA